MIELVETCNFLIGRRQMQVGAIARPFLKWAGGKSQLLNQFEPYYPVELRAGQITRYVEPFVGGGAVFLDVIQRYDVQLAYLFDINRELILAYDVIRRDPRGLIKLLGQYHEHYYSLDQDARKRYFYAMRDEYNALRAQVDAEHFSESWILRVAHLIFLNKTCFNGLYRVNSKGGFNVPFGRYKRPAILDEENILRVSELLQHVTLMFGDFRDCEPFVNDTTFVYFDPPYRPLNNTSSFTSYSKDRFSDDDQIALGQFYAHLDQQSQARLMLSNSDPTNVNPKDTFFDDLYSGFKIHRVHANRMINSKASGRGKISELLITNY